MKYVKGNLLDLAEEGKFDVIVHGCNCLNTMGSGIARQIRDRYPKAYLIDQASPKGNENKLGNFTQAHIDGYRRYSPHQRGFRPYSFTIINAYTQFGFNPRNVVNTDYEALESVFWQIKLLYDLNPQAPCRIGIPMIGAGLGGGDWKVIETIIDSIGFSDLTCVQYQEGTDVHQV